MLYIYRLEREREREREKRKENGTVSTNDRAKPLDTNANYFISNNMGRYHRHLDFDFDTHVP